MVAEIVVLNKIIDASIEEELPLDYEEDGRFHLISATAAFLKRDLKRNVCFCEVVVSSYAIDEFRLHFRVNKTTFEVVAQESTACMHWKTALSATAMLRIPCDADKNWHMAWNWFRTANGKHIFRSDFPFGNFGLPCKTFRLFLENFRSGKPNQSYHLHPNRNFLEFFSRW